MRNVLALILSLVSFFFLFESLNAVAVLLDNSFNLWGIVVFVIFMFANYISFAMPAYATACFQKNKWPILTFYVVVILWEIFVFIAVCRLQGFSLLALIVCGSVAMAALVSFAKSREVGICYATELQDLTEQAEWEDWTTNRFLHCKKELDEKHKQIAIMGFVVYGLAILLSILILQAVENAW